MTAKEDLISFSIPVLKVAQPNRLLLYWST